MRSGSGADRLRQGRSARADRADDPRRRLRRASPRSRPIRSPRGCPSCGQSVAGWCGRRFGVELDPDTEVIPTYGSQGSDLHCSRRCSSTATATGASSSRRSRATRCPTGAPPSPEPTSLQLPLRRGERLPARSRRGRRRDLGPSGHCLDQLSEQPDRGDRAARRSRATRRPRARARVPALRRTRPTRSSGSTSLRAPRSRCATAANVAVFNTLSKRSSMTGYRSGFVGRRRRPHRRAEAVQALGRHRAAGVRAARVGRRPGTTRSTSSARGPPTGASETLLLPTLARKGIRVAGSEATMYLWLEVPQGQTSGGVRGRGCSSTG